MSQKGLVKIILGIIIVILASTVGYLAITQGEIFPSSISGPKPKNNTVSLGQQFTLKKGQTTKIANTDLEVGITEFYNSPCSKDVQCFWSGVGIGFEYHFNGEVQKGIDLVQAFGYQITTIKTDYETYANLIVEKMK